MIRALLLALLAGLMMGTTVLGDGVQVTGGVEIYRVLEGPPGDSFAADIQAPRASCTAPCHIYVHGRDSTPPDGVTLAELMENGVWEIDYGDPGKGDWARGARAGGANPHDKNVDNAFQGGHVYEDPGQYTITLTIEYGGETRIDSVPVTINDPDTVFSATTTCVDTAAAATPAAGVDGCPSSATAFLNTDDFDAAIATCGVDSGAGRCLFRNESVFTQNPKIDWTGSAERQIGGYGSGDRFQIDASGLSSLGTNQGVWEFDDDAINGITFYHGDLFGDVTSEDMRCVNIENVNGATPEWVLFWDMKIRYCDTLIWARVNNGPDPSAIFPANWGVVESELVYQSGNGGYAWYWKGRNLMRYGNLIGDNLERPSEGDSGEHVARQGFCAGCASQANDLGWHDHSGVQQSGRDVIGCCFTNATGGGPCDNSNNGGTVDTWRDGPAVNATTPEDWWSEYNVIADQHVAKCRESVEDMHIGTTGSSTTYTEEHHRYYLVEDILFTAYGVTGDSSTWSLRVENGDEIWVRNLVMDATPVGSGSNRFINVQTNCAQQADTGYNTPGRLSVKNLTYHQNSATGEGRDLVFHSADNSPCNAEWDIELDDSVIWQPGGGSDWISEATGAFVSQTCCGGACPGACNIEPTNEPFPLYTTADAALGDFLPSSPSSGLDPLDAVTCGEVVRDARGCTRETSGSCDAGALDTGADCGVVDPPDPGETLYAQGSGTWSSASHWSTNPGGGSSDGPPQADDAVRIESGDTTTISALATAASLLCDEGALETSSAVDIVLAGDAVIDDCDLSATSTGNYGEVGLVFTADANLDGEQASAPPEHLILRWLDAGGNSIAYRPVGAVPAGQDFNLGNGSTGAGGVIACDCTRATGGCPGNCVIEMQSGNCALVDMDGTGTVIVDMLEHEDQGTTCNPSLLGNGYTLGTAGGFDGSYRLGGAASEILYRFEGDNGGDFVIPGDFLMTKLVRLETNGQDVNAGGFARLGTQDSTPGAAVLDLTGGAVVQADYFRGDDGPNFGRIDFAASGSGIIARDNAAVVGTNHFVREGGSDIASGLDDTNAFETWDRCMAEIDGTGDSCSFAEGDTFPASSPADFNSSGNVRAYNNGGGSAAPVINPAAGDTLDITGSGRLGGVEVSVP